MRLSIELKNVTVNTSLVEASVANEMPTRKYENFVAELWKVEDDGVFPTSSEHLGLAICHSDNWQDIEFRTRSRLDQLALNQFAGRQGLCRDGLREQVSKVLLEFINDNEFKTFEHLPNKKIRYIQG